jgi:hypothetical protein
MRRWLLVVLLGLVTCSSGTVVPQTPETEKFGVEAIPPYNRDEWGRWIDVDKDCQNSRAEVLIEESAVPVTFTTENKCAVATGQWTCPYTGAVVTSATLLDIDHVVALEEAHNAGGWRWTKEQKLAYANDTTNPLHLVAATASANRSKGARPPTEWLPTDPTKRCAYLKARVIVLEKWGLALDCGLYVRLISENCR